MYLAPETTRLFESAEQLTGKADDTYVTVERLLLGLVMAQGRVLQTS